jgi:hypothetical protein
MLRCATDALEPDELLDRVDWDEWLSQQCQLPSGCAQQEQAALPENRGGMQGRLWLLLLEQRVTSLRICMISKRTAVN